MPQHVKITKDGQEAEVLPESLKAYERHGWTVVDDGSSESAPETPEDEVAPVVTEVVPQVPTGRTKTKE